MRFFGKSLIDALAYTISGSLQRRLIEYALKRLLGSYVKNDLRSDAIDLQLRSGKLSFKDLELRTEAFDDKFLGTGLKIVSGRVDFLEIHVPPGELLDGKIKILVHGASIVTQLTSAGAWSESLNAAEQSISEAIDNVTDSFLMGMSTEDVGVSDAVPESAILQRTIEALLANLTLEFSDLCLCLEDSSSNSLLLEVDSLLWTPAKDGRSKEVSTRGIGINLVPQTREDRDSKVWQDSVERASASDSASSSSYDDAELMESTIFGVEQSRSLYMSAMSSQEPNASAADIELKNEETPVKRYIMYTTGCHGVLSSGKDAQMSLDLSFSSLDLALGRFELLLLTQLASKFQSEVSGQRSKSYSEEPSVLNVEVRFDAITCDVNLVDGHDLKDKHPCTETTKSARLSLHRLILQHETSKNFQVDFAYFVLNLGGSIMSSSADNSTGCKFIAKSWHDGIITVNDICCELDHHHQIDAFKNSFMDLLQVWSRGSKAAEHRAASAATSKDRDFAYNLGLNCPKIAVKCSYADLDIILSCQNVAVHVSSTTPRSRLSVTFQDAKLVIDGFNILCIAPGKMPNAVDLTSAHTKVPQPTLEFINYEELFEHPERDSKADATTMRALKGKAKDIADYTLRASLAHLSVNLNYAVIKSCQAIVYSLQSYVGEKVDRLSSSSAKARSSMISMVVLEVAQLTFDLQCQDARLFCNLGKGSFFVVQNMKDIAVFTADFSQAHLSAATTSDKTSRILHYGLHCDHTRPLGLPVVSFRARRNLSSRKAGQTMIRLGLADVQLEYSPEMPWLDALMALYADIETKNHKAVAMENNADIRFAIDLTNVSIGLNPYSGKSKGILYLRRSVLHGSRTSNTDPILFTMQAGVMELFLIDNIDGDQGPTDQDKRPNKDSIALALARLGFVKVIAAETVEIAFILNKTSDNSFQTSVDLSGAIVTIGTCADSLATLTALLTLLRLPIVLSDELKYRLGINGNEQGPIDVFAEIEDDAYTTASSDLTPLKTEFRDADDMFPLVSDEQETLVHIAGNNLIVQQEMTPVVDEYFMAKSNAGVGEALTSRIRHKILTLNAKKCFVIWNLYDGYDWEHTRSQISSAINRAMALAEERKRQQNDRKANAASSASEDDEDLIDDNSDEIGDILFNSIYIALPSDAKAEDVTKSINEALAQEDDSDTATQTTVTQAPNLRTMKSSAEGALQLGRSRNHKVRIDISGIDLNFELYDAIEGEVQTSVTIRAHEFEIVDNVSTSTWKKFLTYHRGAGLRDSTDKMADIQITGVKPVAGLAAAELAIKTRISALRLHVDQDTLDFLTRFFEFKDVETSAANIPAEELYIQRFEIEAIPIKIDYKPKRVDLKSLRSGRTTELKNIFILEDSNMILKHVILYGVCGLARIFQHLNDIWLAHIRARQLPTVLAGVSPLRSLASFGSGLRSLVTLPVSEYRKDGSILPGLRKGLGAFAKTSGTEAVRLGAKLAVGTQNMLQAAEQSLSSRESHPGEGQSSHAISMYADQPRNIQQGLSQAMTGLSRNVSMAKEALTAMPQNLEEETDARGIVRVAAKTVPVAVLRPLIGTTEMISKTLLGLRNTMDPEQRRLNDDKYKHAG